MNKKSLFQITPRMLIATLVGAVLFTLMSYFVVLPTPIAGTFFFPSYAVLGFFATLFGPISGALISLSGMLVVGVLWNNIVLSYTIASVVCGFIYGIAIKYVRADQGVFTDKDIIAYNFTQVIGNFAAWAVIAPVLEILLNPGARPLREIVLQGVVTSFVDILSAEFIGTPLLFIYARERKRQLNKKNSA